MEEINDIHHSIQDTFDNRIQSALISYQIQNGRQFVSYSDDFWKMLNYPGKKTFEEAVGSSMAKLIPEENRFKIQSEIIQQLAQKGNYQVEYVMYRNGGDLSLWVVECGQEYIGKDGQTKYHAIIFDITPIKQASKAIAYQVSYDDLTGLLNKTTFCQQVQKILETNPNEEFEIMSMNIERFKIINDLFGEKTGDKILKYLADFLKKTNLPQSVSGRLHSDIFLLFYPKGNNNRERFMKALKVLAGSFTLDYKILLRFGVYPIKERNLTVSTMIDRTLLALLKVKESGMVDIFEYDTAMRNSLMVEQSIVNDMNDALTKKQFVVYLQPKYDANKANIVGAEALVRWIHPVKNQIPPSEFVPVFEHNGFIFKVDQFVWEETCRILRKWLDDGRNPPPISVNVSRIDFYNTQLVNIFDNLIKRYDLPPRLLELELTESAYTDNPQQIIEITKELQSKGFKILMDDFGSGYSSLNMLKELPVDILKIDLKFLDNNGEKGRGGNILNSIIRMAKWMQMPVIVEGVETKAQADFLRTIGCNYIQGYYFSKPVPIEEFEKLLDNQGKPLKAKKQEVANWPSDKDLEELLNPDTNFSRLFNGIIGGIGLYEFYDNKLELLRANDNFFNLMEESPEVVMAKSKQILDYILEEDRETFLQAIETARDGELGECVIRQRFVNGTILWLHARISIILDDKERLLLFISWEDVSQQYDQKENMKELADCVPVGFIFGTLANGKVEIEYTNRWISELDGNLTHIENNKPSLSFSNLIGKEKFKEFIDYTNQATNFQEPYTIEHQFSNYFGRSYWLQTTIYIRPIDDSSFVIYANVFDLT